MSPVTCSLTRDPVPLAVEARSLNHWISEEVLHVGILQLTEYFPYIISLKLLPVLQNRYSLSLLVQKLRLGTVSNLSKVS